jgi:hypothetical protein
VAIHRLKDFDRIPGILRSVETVSQDKVQNRASVRCIVGSPAAHLFSDVPERSCARFALWSNTTGRDRSDRASVRCSYFLGLKRARPKTAEAKARFEIFSFIAVAFSSHSPLSSLSIGRLQHHTDRLPASQLPSFTPLTSHLHHDGRRQQH